MKIAWISKIEWDMPHKTSRIKLAEALTNRGHNITLYMVKCFGEKDSPDSTIKCIPTIDYPFLSGLFYGILVFFYFPYLLSKEKYDLIIIDSTKVWLPFTIPLKMLNIPIIVDIRTLPIDIENSFTFTVICYLAKKIARGVTTISPELKKVLREKYNIKNLRIGIWTSGVSINDFHQKKQDHNKRTSTLKLLYHGDYSPTRGIEQLILSIKELDKTIKNQITLQIIGMPKNKIPLLNTLITDNNLENQITIQTKVSYQQIVEYIKKADAGIIPLPPENLWWKVSVPLKTLEYLAMEKPIIATNIPIHKKIFKKTECGILISDAHPSTIAKGIESLYQKRAFIPQMGINGRKIIEKEFTWETIAQEAESFYDTII